MVVFNGVREEKKIYFFCNFLLREAVKGVKKAKARAGEKEPALRGLPRSGDLEGKGGCCEALLSATGIVGKGRVRATWISAATRATAEAGAVVVTSAGRIGSNLMVFMS